MQTFPGIIFKLINVNVAGPTLLFEKYIDGELRKFYACSAVRDSGLCNSFTQPNDKIIKRPLTSYNHKTLYLRLNQLMSSQTVDRIYCHTCNILIFSSEKIKHRNHDLQKCLTNYQMTHPTEFLKPLSNAKKEAQYFFSEKTTEDIAQMLLKLKAKHIVCIGVPRLYEYILHHYGNEMTCLLLDFDARFVSIIRYYQRLFILGHINYLSERIENHVTGSYWVVPKSEKKPY